MEPNSLEYTIIDECKCGYEELFNLIGLINFNDTNEIDRFVKRLVRLHKNGYLECKFDAKVKKEITEEQLKDHLQLRLVNCEDLESYPESEKEFSFFATDKALNQLLEKDRPIVQ